MNVQNKTRPENIWPLKCGQISSVDIEFAASIFNTIEQQLGIIQTWSHSPKYSSWVLRVRASNSNLTSYANPPGQSVIVQRQRMPLFKFNYRL